MEGGAAPADVASVAAALGSRHRLHGAALGDSVLDEAFWSIKRHCLHAGTLAAYIARFSAPEGLFWAKLSAASVLAVAPILVLGSLTQRRLVRGLTFGAVK